MYRLRGLLLRVFVLYARLRYRRLARAVVRDIQEYERSGVHVAAIVGVRVLALLRGDDHARPPPLVRGGGERCPVADLDRDTFNQRAVVDCRTAGEGLFLRTLARQLARRGIGVPFAEYDLVAEMRGAPRIGMQALLRSYPA